MFTVKPSAEQITQRQHESLPPMPADAPTVSAAAWSRLTPEVLAEALVNDKLTESNPAWLIFPGVSGIEGPAGNWYDQPAGSQRTIKLTDSTQVTETLAELIPGRLFRYDMTNFTGIFGSLSYGVYAKWEFEPADNGTLARWTWAFPGRGPVRNAIMRRVVKPLRQRYTEATVKRILKLIEAEQR